MDNRTTTDKAFIMASIRERQINKLFKQTQTHYQIRKDSAVNSYEKWDSYVTSGLTKICAEIKIRDCNFYIWKNEGFILEKDKYDYLITLCSTEKAKRNNVQPWYINIFECNNKILIWNLFDVLPHLTLTQKRCRETTKGSSNKYIMKDVYLLPANKSTIYYLSIPNDLNKRVEECYEMFINNEGDYYIEK